MTIIEVEKIIDCVSSWFNIHDNLVLLSLTGSWARSEASSTSDLDILIISIDQNTLIKDLNWHNEIPWSAFNMSPYSWRDEEYDNGAWSRHVNIENVGDIEFAVEGLPWLIDLRNSDNFENFLKAGFRVVADKIDFS